MGSGWPLPAQGHKKRARGLASPTSRMIPSAWLSSGIYKERLRKLAPEAKREAEKEARKKAALRREILTVRQKLNREARRKGCTVERAKEDRART